VKTYPAVLLVWLLAARRWRPVAGAVAGYAALAAVAGAVLPPQAWTDWWSKVLPLGGYGCWVPNLYHPGAPWNQGINGLTARLFLPGGPPALVPSLLLAKAVPLALSLLLVLLTCRRLTRLRGTATDAERTDVAFGAGLPLMVAITPMAWWHHLAFTLPSACLVLAWTIRRKQALLPAAGLFLGVIACPIPVDSPALLPWPWAFLIWVKLYAVLGLWAMFHTARIQEEIPAPDGRSTGSRLTTEAQRA
jgi:hypothetical protein